MTTSTRNRILDAYRDLLIEHGGVGVSLDAVAARAGLSKGGLLYHFPAKSALLVALTERLRAYTDVNVERARREGAVRAFLDTSIPREDEARHYWAALTAIAADRRGSPPEAQETLNDVFTLWSGLLHAEIDDPVLADTIRLVGDGLFLTAVAGLPRPTKAQVRAVVDELEARAHRTTRPVAPANGS